MTEAIGTLNAENRLAAARCYALMIGAEARPGAVSCVASGDAWRPCTAAPSAPVAPMAASGWHLRSLVAVRRIALFVSAAAGPLCIYRWKTQTCVPKRPMVGG